MSKSWRARRESLLIPSPAEKPQLSFEQQRVLNTKQCTAEGVREGLKAAAIAGVASAVPTLIGVRVIPWAKANLNYTAQALIISSAAIAAYFIVADKTILECARRNTRANYDRLK
ncbi:unnamed protein product [Victoria cruziana]